MVLRMTLLLFILWTQILGRKSTEVGISALNCSFAKDLCGWIMDGHEGQWNISAKSILPHPPGTGGSYFLAQSETQHDDGYLFSPRVHTDTPYIRAKFFLLMAPNARFYFGYKESETVGKGMHLVYAYEGYKEKKWEEIRIDLADENLDEDFQLYFQIQLRKGSFVGISQLSVEEYVPVNSVINSTNSSGISSTLEEQNFQSETSPPYPSTSSKHSSTTIGSTTISHEKDENLAFHTSSQDSSSVEGRSSTKEELLTSSKHLSDITENSSLATGLYGVSNSTNSSSLGQLNVVKPTEDQNRSSTATWITILTATLSSFFAVVAIMLIVSVVHLIRNNRKLYESIN